MALYKFECPKCCAEVVRILPAEPRDLKCPRDGSKMRRKRTSPGTSVKEVLDNGLMSRVLERPADAQRLFAERSRTKEDRG